MTESPHTSDSAPLLVSIVTVVYNGAATLERTIRSVREQTYPHLHYVVIDGGSTDGTLDIITQHADFIDHWVSEPDRGISDAFNKGIAACRGAVIGLLNADDWYEPDTVEQVVARHAQGDIFYGKLRYWQGEQPGYVFGANHRLLKREMSINHPAVFMRSAVFAQFGNFSVDYTCAMDYELLLRCYLGQARFVAIDTVLTNMQRAGISDANWRTGCREVLQAKRQHLGPSIKHHLWFQKQVWAIRLSRWLEQSRGRAFLRWYRARLSPVQKTTD
ncbi:MAG: glycosyltransferase family 2 protein [Bacteroidota bacterium]